MDRRELLARSAAIAALSISGAGCATAASATYVKPGDAGWPSESDWASLNTQTDGALLPGASPALDSADAKALIENPIYLGDQPGLTEISGWVDHWQFQPSAYVMRAKNAADVAAALRFARAHNVRVAVKGGGHSYLGGSNAPDSLLIWTRAMDAIEMHDAFVPQGSSAPAVHAVSVGAGCFWGRVYDAVTTNGGRYVQGGGCTTVGVAGHVQGGGFGSFSKGFGLAAASLLEAEIVTADGQVRIVNEARESDLYWALKGGGGGTFGVVTRLTLKTHELPRYFGTAEFSVQASSDEALRRVAAKFIETYAANLHNEHWGEQARLTQHNQLMVRMNFQGIDQDTARAAFKDFSDFLAAHPSDYTLTEPTVILHLPARHMWNRSFFEQFAPSAIIADHRPGASARDYWWKGDGDQASASIAGYTSTWLPASLLEPANQAKLVDAWFNASRHWPSAFHFNKGLAGASAETIAASRACAMNPEVLDAFALAIIASEGPCLYPGLPAPDPAEWRERAAKIGAAMQALKAFAPNAGCYISECDYVNENWRRDFWGEHWQRLDAIKRRYDPDRVFIVHHGVGDA
ncbi:MAG: FAD-binding protein [Pseudomonadota bacterium]